MTSLGSAGNIPCLDRLVGTDGEDFEPGKKNILSKIFPKSDSRIFPAGKIFRAARQTKHVVVFYVEQSA